MFVSVLGTDKCWHHVNVEQISQVIESQGMLRVKFAYPVGKSEKTETYSFWVSDAESKKDLLSAMKVKERQPVTKKDKTFTVPKDIRSQMSLE